MAESSAQIPDDSKKRYADEMAKYQSAKDGYHRWLALSGAVMWGVDHDAGDTIRANAALVLKNAEQYKTDWNYGNAVHQANLALGRQALRDGDMAAARGFLLAAGHTRGSPQLDTFGPNMLLAKEMLEKGESATVLEYFEACRKFWRMDNGALDVWADMVRDGKRPNFMANLLY